MNILSDLYRTILARKGGDVDNSYVANLFVRGNKKIAQKVGEEATETVIAAITKDKQELICESADLLFHLLILWAENGVLPSDVEAELLRREGVSGIAEKAARKS